MLFRARCGEERLLRNQTLLVIKWEIGLSFSAATAKGRAIDQ